MSNHAPPRGLIDRDLRVHGCNPLYAGFFGSTPREVMGEVYHDHFGLELSNERMRYVRLALETGETHSCVGSLGGVLFRCSYQPIPPSSASGRPDLVGCNSAPFMLSFVEKAMRMENYHLMEYHDFGVLNVLSPVELQVLARLCRGMTSRDIAEETHRSVRTIEGHRRNIGLKTGLSGISDLISKATSAGLGVLPYDKIKVSSREEKVAVRAS
ncbi:MAG: LuxR C-terminal-related transcriptional regulator [Phycisphaerales bacterium JB043]